MSEIQGVSSEKVLRRKCPETEPEPFLNDTGIKTGFIPSDAHYNFVNPDHYKNGSVETIEKMRRIWGNEATALHCEMCAFKYRERIGTKPDQPLDRELAKIYWYEDKAKELRGENNGR